MVKLKTNFKGKLLLITIFTTTVIFGSFLLITGGIFRNQSVKQSKEIAIAEAARYATLSKDYFDFDMGFAKSIANSMQYLGKLSQDERDTIYGNMMLQMLKMNPKYISVWSSMELQFYQEGYAKDHGRKLLVSMRQGDQMVITHYMRDMDGPNPESDYFKIKEKNEPTLAEPYIDPDIGNFYITSLIYPIHIQGKFAGLGGIDIPLEALQGFVDNMRLYQGSSAYVISNTGIILGHSDTSLIGKNITEVYSDLNKEYKILDKIQKGDIINFSHSENNVSLYTSVVPFVVEGTSTPWAFSISIPLETIMSEGRQQNRWLFIFGILGLGLLFLVIILYASSITKPVIATTKVFKELSEGNIDLGMKLNIHTGGKLDELAFAVNKLIDSLHRTEIFANEIEKGNLDAEISIHGQKDKLGNAMHKMAKGLKTSKLKEETQRIEEEKRRWASEGIEIFNELLRNDNDDLDRYIHGIISNLVNYTNSNQGGIYFVRTSDLGTKSIELSGSYAYDGEKFNRKNLEYGEGLLGVSILEGKTIFIDTVTDNYFSISSGLGSHRPKCLLIVPLKTKDEVIGAIELASFKIFENYEKKFIELVSESIAVTFSGLFLQQKTKILLERTRKQTEDIATQEDQLRQSLEQMQVNLELAERSQKALEEKLIQTENELAKCKGLKS